MVQSLHSHSLLMDLTLSLELTEPPFTGVIQILFLQSSETHAIMRESIKLLSHTTTHRSSLLAQSMISESGTLLPGKNFSELRSQDLNA